ncbi:MAG: glycosyltransferase [Desulfitobacteriaceae bacterium]|nr:glycosyltransferase [Desulfitobacteriaceae bacterium]
MKKNILFFSVSIGAGHDLAAKSLELQFKQSIPDVKTKIIDTFDYINPTLHKVVVGSYMETLKFSPKVWGYLYSQAENGERMVDLGQMLNKLLSYRLQLLIDKFQPDVIICTHAFPAGIVSVLKEKTKLKIPTVVVLTDFTIHAFWIHPNTDCFVIPSNQLTYEGIAQGMPPDKIKPFGIPIRTEFSFPLDKQIVKERLGLDNRPVILVMGGGLGMGAVKETVRSLIANEDNQVLAVCGKNINLQKELGTLSYTSRNLHVYGFVENVGELMSAADLIVTKPGGLTTAEVLAKGLPMVIVDPLPGQEDRNTEFLLNWGVGVKAKHHEGLPPLINQLMKNGLRMKQMREMALHLAKPSSAEDISRFVCQKYLV